MYLLEQFPWSLAEAQALMACPALESATMALDGVVSIREDTVTTPPLTLMPLVPQSRQASVAKV
jgi:hypothetical protein